MPRNEASPDMERPSGGITERRIVFGLIVLTLFLAGLPYLLGYFIVPPRMRFIGTAYNIDDYCNYLSWLRQTADGYFFLHNLFATDPQKDLEFNIFFWLLGRFAHVTHLSSAAVLQIARVGGGAGLLWLIYRFYKFCLPGSPAARLTAFGFACLSSGFGWVNWRHWQDKSLSGSPIDAWQPEAYTFHSLYTSSLFVVSTLLILGALYALLLGEETGQWRYPVIAGVCGAILGNMHSYDVLHLSAAWGLFLLVWSIRIDQWQGVALSWGRGALALALTLPTTAYQYYIFKAEAVFHKRANVPTLSPHVWQYVLGYGFVFIFAVVALGWVGRTYFASPADRNPAIADGAAPALFADARVAVFAACWAVGGLAIAYFPVPFQRKMLMGEHIPLCLLAGVGAVLLTRRLAPAARAMALVLLVLATFPSTAFFLRRDILHLENNRSETGMMPFLPDTLFDAYSWMRHNLHTPRDEAVLSIPTLAAPLPGAVGRVVWVGHWAETPDYGKKIVLFSHFADVQTPDDQRIAFLESIPVAYLLYPNDVSRLGYRTKDHVRHHFADFAHTPPAYLVPLYQNQDFTLFQIARPGPPP